MKTIEIITLLSLLTILFTVVYLSVQADKERSRYLIKYKEELYPTNYFKQTDNCISFSSINGRWYNLCGNYVIYNNF